VTLNPPGREQEGWHFPAVELPAGSPSKAVMISTTGKIKTGVGGVIEGLDGRRWGRVAREELGVWVLQGGRIAKKATQVRFLSFSSHPVPALFPRAPHTTASQLSYP
jgi:hypothetical protein